MEARCLKNSSAQPQNTNAGHGAPRSRRRITARHDFISRPEKAGIQAHIGAEVTSTTGVRYPLLAETREGYQNLCRLMTRMKLRAPKGKGAITEHELAAYARGLVCLTGGECGPLTLAIPGKTGRRTIEQLIGIFGRENVYVELQRHYDREEEAINQQALSARGNIPSSAAGDEWGPLRLAARAGNPRRLHLHSKPPNAGNRGPPACEKLATSSENAAADGAAFRRPSGSNREHRGPFLAGCSSR